VRHPFLIEIIGLSVIEKEYFFPDKVSIVKHFESVDIDFDNEAKKP
jgi:hypothetical protein